MEFLLDVGLIFSSKNGRYEIGKARIHLGHDSPLISKFHTNWRIRAIQSLDQVQEKSPEQEDLHYSSVITISESDFQKIKSLHVKHIENIKAIIKDSAAEGVYVFAMDYFKI